MADPCIICARQTNSKVKPGIFPCLGCKQIFCTQHVAFHRQELTNELDLVIGERNELQEKLDRDQELPNVSADLKLIDEWMNKTIAQVHQVADNVRQQVILLAEKQKKSIKDQFTELSKQLDTFRENENYYEKDIELLKEKCAHLNSLLKPLKANVTVTDAASLLTQAITLGHTEEKSAVILQKTKAEPDKTVSFIENLVQRQKPYKSIRMPHNGSVYLGNDVVFIRNGDNFTMIDLKTNSLDCACIANSSRYIFCGSTYLNGLLCTDPNGSSKIELYKINGGSLSKTSETKTNIRKSICMFSFDDRMMHVCHGENGNNCIEEWSLTGQL